MKRSDSLQLLGLMCGVGLLLGGCLIKPARVPTRHFVLAPIPAPEHAPSSAQQVSIEVGFVKMPSYLLRDAMVVRKSANEVEYLEDALWAERLDQGFRQRLADNLSSLLASHQAHLSASERRRVVVRVSVDVKQFDVDTQGRGTLIASWRLTLPGSEKAVKTGLTHLHLTRPAPSPLANPQVIATTLSTLIADFSQELAKTIRESQAKLPGSSLRLK